jgi:mono/diheme cytochrome c family protein
MRSTRSPLSHTLLLFAAVAGYCSVTGCDSPITNFHPNRIYVARMERSQGTNLQLALADTNSALEDLFGTPDKPLWPQFSEHDSDLSQLVQMERLQRASGAVRSDEADQHVGLYREHCVQCHGISGDGLGPTSRFLNPYPRDFRLGKFKFKSTPIGKRPARSDLHRVLTDGLKGTSMPSFRVLKEDELEVLIDYVIFLSVRGQVERQMITDAALELDYESGDRLYDRANRESNPELFKTQVDRVIKIAADAAKQWLQAEEDVTVVPEPPTEFPLYSDTLSLADDEREKLHASIVRGRKLFQGPIANCASCHGVTAMGDGQTNNYDAWTKDWAEGIDLQSKDDLRPFLKLGALRPRVILPRNLRTGIHRGGSEPRQLYLRIVNGIDGSPMPATAMKPANPQGLTPNDVWDLVNFLLNMPNEEISKDASIAVAQRSDN